MTNVATCEVACPPLFANALMVGTLSVRVSVPEVTAVLLAVAAGVKSSFRVQT